MQAAIPPAFQLEILLHSRQLSAAQLVDRQVIQELVGTKQDLADRLKLAVKQFASLDNSAYAITKCFLRQSLLESAIQRESALAPMLKERMASGNVLAALKR